MLKTYYISSSGQPANAVEEHDTFGPALLAWLENCGAVLSNSGGQSVMMDEDDGEDLRWLEHADVAYVTGEMACRRLSAQDLDDIDTPQKVYNLLTTP